MHGEGAKVLISFYDVSHRKSTDVVLQKTIERRGVNAMFWSPIGRFLLLAGLPNLNGALEFWNCEEFELVATAEHFMLTDVEWDPSGRYVATFASALRHQVCCSLVSSVNILIVLDGKWICNLGFPRSSII